MSCLARALGVRAEKRGGGSLNLGTSLFHKQTCISYVTNSVGNTTLYNKQYNDNLKEILFYNNNSFKSSLYCLLYKLVFPTLFARATGLPNKSAAVRSGLVIHRLSKLRVLTLLSGVRRILGRGLFPVSAGPPDPLDRAPARPTAPRFHTPIPCRGVLASPGAGCEGGRGFLLRCFRIPP